MKLIHFNLPDLISKKSIENSEKELKLIYQQCYLELQKALLSFQYKNPQSKKWCDEWRKKLGEIYKETINTFL